MLRRVLSLLFFAFFLITVQTLADSSLRRWGTELDSWREEGASAITDSPVCANGVRLSAWSYGEGEDYQFAIAHVEYTLPLPTWARSMDITVAYSGNDGEWGSGPAGRLWVKLGDSVEGDSFELPEGRKSQSVRLSTRDYDNNGWITLRVIAEGSQEIDVNYINIRFRDSSYHAKVVTRQYAKYVWRPWSYYTYWYFYPGRYHLHWDPMLGCWVKYTYPKHPYYWAQRRARYNAYLRGYYKGRQDERRWQVVTGGRGHIHKWSTGYAVARYTYRTSRGRARSIERVRGVLSQHKRGRSAIGRVTQVHQNKSALERAREWQKGTRVTAEVPTSVREDRTPRRDATEVKVRRETSVRTGTRADLGNGARQSFSTRTKVRSGTLVDRGPSDPGQSIQRAPSNRSSKEDVHKTRREETRVRMGQSKPRQDVRTTSDRSTHTKQRTETTTRSSNTSKRTRVAKKDDRDKVSDKTTVSRKRMASSSARGTRRGAGRR